MCYLLAARPGVISGLASILHTVLRSKVPETVLAKCSAADRVVLENILIIAQEMVPLLDISMCSVQVHEQTYQVTIPMTSSAYISLRDLRSIESYSPARISALDIHCSEHGCALRVSVTDEHVPISTSELDIVRLTKKRYRT
jgi:hypothetical protein